MGAIAQAIVFALALIGLAQQANPTDATGLLVTVTVRPDHLVIRDGENLGVTVELIAGPKGAYIPNHFGDFEENCQSGFAAEIFTLKGNRASDSSKSCAADILFGARSLSAELARDYVFLKPGETRRWHTTLTGITKTSGTYEIQAEYLSFQTGIEQVAALPEVRGLMVIGHIRATPVRVRIR